MRRTGVVPVTRRRADGRLKMLPFVFQLERWQEAGSTNNNKQADRQQRADVRVKWRVVLPVASTAALAALMHCSACWWRAVHSSPRRAIEPTVVVSLSRAASVWQASFLWRVPVLVID